MFARCCSFVAILSAGTASAHQPKSRYVIIRHQGSSERSLCISPDYLRACLRRWGNQWTWSGGAGFHDARHTAATVLLILGVPTATAVAIMGLVQREHGQALPASRRDVAKQVGGRLWAVDGQPEGRSGDGNDNHSSAGIPAPTKDRWPGSEGRWTGVLWAAVTVSRLTALASSPVPVTVAAGTRRGLSGLCWSSRRWSGRW
jgi:hypothetical protein